MNVVVIGVSKDSAASHQRFAEKHNLPFILLSDLELTAIQAYGVWQEKKLYGKVSMGVVRTTYIIDETGNIEKIMLKVKPDTNAADILAYLRGEALSSAFTPAIGCSPCGCIFFCPAQRGEAVFHRAKHERRRQRKRPVRRTGAAQHECVSVRRGLHRAAVQQRVEHCVPGSRHGG